jgi:hypothetical protein
VFPGYPVFPGSSGRPLPGFCNEGGGLGPWGEHPHSYRQPATVPAHTQQKNGHGVVSRPTKLTEELWGRDEVQRRFWA